MKWRRRVRVWLVVPLLGLALGIAVYAAPEVRLPGPIGARIGAGAVRDDPRVAPTIRVALQESTTRSELLAITSPAEGVGWAVGRDGVIVRTTDRGQTWRQQSAGTRGHLGAIATLSASSAWIFDAQAQRLLRTVDGGSSWQHGPEEITRVTALGATAPSTVWAFADEAMWLSIDGGAHWRKQSRKRQTVHDVAVGSQKAAWAVGSYGPPGKTPAIVSTLDGGMTWVEQYSGIDQDVFSVTAVSPEVAWITNGFEIRRTTDGGRSWHTVLVSVDGSPIHLAAWSPSTVWAVGGPVSHAYVALTVDGGATWAERRFPEFPGPMDVVASGPTSAWAVGGDGVILALETDD
jgi:photosystem II stability/assembly factor-like uncharacterized protein